MTAAPGPSVSLHRVTDDDLGMFRRFATEPGLVSYRAGARRDGYHHSRLRDDSALP
ncbi:MAG TPA: hypothetical protein VGJ59_10390 [Jatrophihabitantaceae bacterium]|jgi:hypothetical protein